ncbi:N-acetylmuramoyl-L-alanine amidase [Chryseobacterium indologenes]|uniref:N-acetylmuramoyl-L-alanine amidase n=1 Tax=Chryseobacterium indologenes TaxID=253 RepID=UPI001D0D1D34|nr:N-acetylmuramoyl-L-alanine amidase [Chryseobacterium indologenes]UDQ54999.1 N-acetylmuramoyl-L-alanine amidase [Chryseobacterium indologenes]
MRKINYIAVHCTATPQTATVSSIQNYWKNKLGWKMPGYHFIVKPDGEIVQLLDISKVSNGVLGHNHEIINISYIGGVDKNNKAVDNRTDAQKKALLEKLKELKKQFPDAVIQGHRDFKGVKKDCPSFNAKKEYENI